MTDFTKRLVRFNPILVSNNLELDYLSDAKLDFSSFPTAEGIYTVTSYAVGMISLVSFEVYGTVDFWWLLALRNDIINPLTELYVGRQIFIPSLLDYYDWYNKHIVVNDAYDDMVFAPRQITVV